MGTKKTINKILIVTLWLAIGTGMVTLLAAAIRQQKSERCADYSITIKGNKDNLFVDRQDILKMLKTGSGGAIKGQTMSDIDLRKLEQMLENNQWIKDAELYFDNTNILKVTVTEREPLARVFTTAGKSFYIDSEENRIPLSDKLNAKLPVFTGFPEKKTLTAKDSVLLHDVKQTALFLHTNDFWQSQVAQIDITADRDFEMIPVVGNHLVKLGKGDQLERKFHRLFVFYRNVLSKTGFDAYKTIDVQYAGQVIGTKGFTTKSDSVQLRRNVEKLLQQARDMQYDTAMTNHSYAPDPELSATEITPDSENNSPTTGLNKPPVPNPLNTKPKPKAVMKRE